MSTVDFFTNCWERDYREVLSPNFMRNKAARFAYPFRNLIVTVNNVDDPVAAKQLSQDALSRRDVDRVVFVDELLPLALQICALTERDLGKVRNFTSFYLVMVTCTDADYIINCAADINLDRTFDWVTPAIEKLESNAFYLVANPSWGFDPGGAQREAIRIEEPYYISHGYSDACFIGKRRVFAQPIYNFRHPAGKRYPLSHIGEVFEQRVDAYMRNNGYLRLTDSRVMYNHFGELGSAYPQPSLVQKLQKKIGRVIGR